MSEPTGPAPVVLTIGEQQITLSEDNCWVCIFTEANEYDHIYVYEPSTFAIFNNRGVIDQLMQMGYPMQVRRLPRPWDEDAYEKFIAVLAKELEADLEAL